MDEEMRFHIDMEAQRLVRERGLSPAEAHRRAAAAFGGVEKHKEAVRDARGLAWLPGSVLDLKLGVRMMARHPGLTLVGGMGMAVAIAIGASVFGVLHTLLGSGLPLDEGDRVVAIQNLDAATSDQARATHLHDLAAWRGVPSLRDLGAVRTVDRNLAIGGGLPEPVRVAEMTASGFRLARVPPLLGRTLDDADERPGAPAVVVIGYGVWRERFGGDPRAVGRTLRVGGTVHTVVGVMPDGFAFPVNNRVWTPLRLRPAEFERGAAPEVDVFARLAPGATLRQAQAQLDVLGRRAAAAHPGTHARMRLPYVRSFLDAPELAWGLYLLQLGVSLLLVVIAANVAVLVYARTAMRAGEIAVRMALGARRARVVAQLFAELLVLSTAAAALGLGGAHLILAQVRAVVDGMGGEQIPFWWDVRLSWGTVAYAAALALLAAAIAGAVPALRATRPGATAAVRALGGGTGLRMGRTWTALIVAQVAVAVAILPVVAALVWTELVPRARPAPGYAADELLAAHVGLEPGAASDHAAHVADRHASLAARLRATPGVVDVAFASGLPGGEWSAVAEVVDGAGTGRHDVRALRVEPGFFAAAGAAVLAGRPLAPGDGAAPVVVNRSFAAQVLGGGRVLGRRFRYARMPEDLVGATAGTWYEVVGVVGDFPARIRPSGRGIPVLYHAAAPGTLDPAEVLVRVQGAPPESLAPRVREIAAALDPTLRVDAVRSLAELAREERSTERTQAAVVVSLALSVLLLSAAGIHALMAFTVAQRRREIGIRAALGAHPRRIVAAVFARAMRQVGTGVAVGTLLSGAVVLGGGLPAGRAAALLGSVVALVLAVGAMAALGPARRSLRVQPMEALRGG
jgi:predicted permease